MKGRGSRFLCITLIWALLMGSLGGVQAFAAGTFSDVRDGAYYAGAVRWAVAEGVTSGTGSGHFSPGKGCTRAQIVTLLYRVMGEPQSTGRVVFQDVKSSSYYFDAVAWAVEAGVTKGTDEEHFSPNKVCTRGQAVTFIEKAMSSELPDTTVGNPYKDVRATKYFYCAVLWASENKVASGTAADRFSPYQDCTRAQIVTMLYNAAMAIEKNEKEKTTVSCTIDEAKIVENEAGRQVSVHAAVKTLSENAMTFGLFAMEPYETDTKGKTPVATMENVGSDVTFLVPLRKGEEDSLLQKKLVVWPVSAGEGITVVANDFYITNPEAAADNTEAYPVSARGTKKGLKAWTSTADVAMAKQLNASHVAIDVDLGTLLKGTGYSYTYEGKKYEFSSDIKGFRDVFKKYSDEGIKTYAIVYMGIRAPKEYILPSAVSGSRYGKATLYAWNTSNENRKTLEALLSCIAEAWTSDGAHVGDWVFGNELNNVSVYNYAGDISYAEYVDRVCESYRMFHTAIKSTCANARTYLCFDHNWNLAQMPAGSYRGMKLLSDIADGLAREGAVHFDVSLHPYPVPEQWPRIWERKANVTDTSDTEMFSPLNVASVAAGIRASYGDDTHIILSETGITSEATVNGTLTNMENDQAASIAYAYYLAEFSDSIDAITIHREMDQPGETAAGWYLGLFRSSYSDPKPAADVFTYMDTPDWDAHTRAFLSLIKKGDGTQAASWSDIVPGFDPTAFAR